MSNLKYIISKILQFSLFIFSTMIICFSLFIYINNNQTKKTTNTNIGNKYIQTIDNYDSNGTSLTEFFNEDKALDRMKNLYNDLRTNELFEVLEVGNQYIEKYSKDKYKNEIKFVYGEEEEFVNQIIKKNNADEYMTPLKAIQISEYSENTIELKAEMYEGKFFEESDYVLNNSDQNEISVILGNSYIGIYKIGDIIEGEYLFKKFQFKVKGFLKKGTNYNNGRTIENLDTSIVMPFVNCNYIPRDSEEHFFQSILYSMKSTPYIKYKTKSDYNKYINELERLYKKNKLDYSYIQQSVNM